MIAWAAVVALILSAIAYLSSDPSSFFLSLAELGGVLALFALVCAAESFDQT
ncbi:MULTISPECIES: hypothetical protein [Microvirga]|uniref:hypothetical protein n=1 Tax=Microvirga TaxID=186650 RepID=UPI001D0016C8|nr:hypothetical protein [Microvirga lenta]MCB5176305.1 hypothetical protein [Microvirga lenta]